MYRKTSRLQVMKCAVTLVLLVGCAVSATEPVTAIDVVAFRDPMCRPEATEDCIVLVPPGAHVALPTESFELLVHGPGELPPIALTVNDTPVEGELLESTCDASGTIATLEVAPLGLGLVDVSGELGFRSIDPDRPTRYGSTYASNCYCLGCTTFCAVNGKNEKAGPCC